MSDPTLFDNQEHRRPDAEQGQKVVFKDTDEPTHTDGRYDGKGDWSREALTTMAQAGQDMNRRQKAMITLYEEPSGITAKDFFEWCGSMRLAARVHELREIDQTPPIEDRTKTVQARDGSEPTVSEYYIPKVE